jgi:nucleoside-diphosphate-sugar epimerase
MPSPNGHADQGAAARQGRCLVFGASGYIGSNLVPRLLAGGYSVRASARRLAVIEADGWQGAETVQADHVGDQVDSRDIIGVEPGRHLTLAFGMRAPGAGAIRPDITPTGTDPLP